MIEKAVVTSNGIKHLLKSYEWYEAICEYIWNGFDAGATEVKINFIASKAPLDVINEIKISDNGSGISVKSLSTKFRRIYESEKSSMREQPRNHSLPYGRNGKGRLTFFTFCNSVRWDSTCKEDGKFISQKISISSSQLDTYNSEEIETIEEKTGTIVTFNQIYANHTTYEIDTILMPYLKKEFAWFLELNKEQNYKLLINEEPLNYEDLIHERFQKTLNEGLKNKEFLISIVLWKEKLNLEYSKYYYIKSDGTETWKDTTTLNNKGDNFYHSVYIKSSFFDDFHWSTDNRDSELLKSPSDKDFKDLTENLSKLLKEKRNPFLERYVESLVNEYEKEKIFPNHGNSPVGQYQNQAIRETVKEIYKVQPKVFTDLNPFQKKAFINLLDTLLVLGADDRLLDIISKIVDMTTEERNQFAHVLDYASVSAITKTIALIKDRFKVVQQLKDIILDDTWGTTEAEIQAIVEKHFWLFGEQYNLVTAEEQKFEEALRRYLHLLHGDGVARKPKIQHLNKNKEMDIFTCRRNIGNDTIQNIVVELKHPTVKLGRLEINQVENYLSVVRKDPEFTAKNASWTFILVGRAFDTSGTIENEYLNAKPHGERYLIKSYDSVKVYVMQWSDVFSEFDCRHKYILEKLELDKTKIIEEMKKNKTVKDVVSDVTSNSAVEVATWETPRKPIGTTE